MKQVLSSMNPQESFADTRLLRQVALMRDSRAVPHQGSGFLTKMDEVIHTLVTIGCNRWTASGYPSIDNRRTSHESSALSSKPNILSPLTKSIYDFHPQSTSHDMATSPVMWSSESSNPASFGSADLSWLLTDPSLHIEHYSTAEFPTDPVIALDSIFDDAFDANFRNAIRSNSLG